MLMDAQLIFSDAQAITATARSGNVIDTGPLFSGVTGRNLGVGSQKWIVITCDVAFTDSGSDSTLTVTLETDNNEAFSSTAIVATLGTLPALTAAGTTFIYPMPIAGTAVPYERYISLLYTAANGNLTTGTLTAAIVKDISAYQSYVGGYSTGI